MYDINDNPNVSFLRQRSPVDRNIYIRARRNSAISTVKAKKGASWTQSILLWMILSFTFGFGFVALYDHALAHRSNPFQQTEQ